MSPPLLVVDGISVHFGGLAALSRVSFSLMPGELLGIIGPNGAGKTTLFNLISGIVQPSAGHCCLDGNLLNSLSPEAICRLGVGCTWQNIRLFGQMTVLENVCLALHARPRYTLAEAFIRTPRAWQAGRAVEQEALELLTLVGLVQSAAVPAGSLPYGLQRRLELVRALATHPRLLLLDEPAAGMSVGEAQELAEVIRLVHQERACGILLIEHNLRVVRTLCAQGRLLVLHHGQVLAQGPTREVLADEQVIRAYLGHQVKMNA